MNLNEYFGLVNIVPIIKNHYSNLVKDSPAAWMDLLILLGLPAATILLVPYYTATVNFIILVVTSLTILFGFTFNAAILLSGTSISEHPHEEKRAIEITKGSSLYALLISFITLLYSFAVYVVIDFGGGPFPSIELMSGILYYLLAHYLLTLLVILRNLSALINNDIVN